MPQYAEVGDTVKMHYTCWKQITGEEYESTFKTEPYQFIVGQDRNIPRGVAEAVIDMQPGETKKIKVPRELAFGERHLQNVTVPREQLLGKMVPEIGKTLLLKSRYGNGLMTAKIIEMNENFVVLDPNHPLAGHDLVYEIKLLEITRKGNIY
jgi:FKBP-type peptidyl-prolyl cis-trans isomerase 2